MNEVKSAPAKAQHTPGQWDVEPVGDDPLCILAGGGDWPASLIATMTDPREYPEGVQQANARLIAAAPDLLAACKLVLRREGAIPAHEMNLVAAAVAKAEG